MNVFPAMILIATSIPPANAADANLLTADVNLQPSTSQVNVQPVDGSTARSITVTSGNDKYPGITLKPASGSTWDLSNYSQLETQIKNTGDKPIRVTCRVDNPRNEGNREAWNCEFKNIAPGKTETLKVVFGKSWGFQPSYALDPSRIMAILFFLNPSDTQQSFELISINPSGKAQTTSQSTSSTPANPGDIMPMELVDMRNPDLVSQVKGSSDQITLSRGHVGEGVGLKVQFDAGNDPWPGIRITPMDSKIWNLGQYTQVRAKITNTGSQPISLGLRVDNPTRPDNRNTWNTEQLNIAPNQTATIIVNFGYSYGGKGYALDPTNVNAILLFCSKLNSPVSFKVESIFAGNKTDKDAQYQHQEVDMRIKPKDGIVLGNGNFDADKQARGHHHGKVTWNTNANALDIELPRENSRVELIPEQGYWHLGDGNQLAVTMRNTGDQTITPQLKLDSQGGSIETMADPIAPGKTTVIAMPFAPQVPWQGYFSATEKGKHTVDGTGSSLRSDKCHKLTITSKDGQPAKLQIARIITETAIADTPDWLGQRPPVAGNWVQTMNDNFDGSVLNTSNWSNTGPNYWDKVSRWSPDNAIMGDGVIRLRYEKKYGPHNNQPDQRPHNLTGEIFANYTGGYLESHHKFEQRYGYFETRVKFPTAKGIWPAFWMMPERGPDVPRAERGTTRNGGMEFDILEHLTVWGPNRYNVAFHWDDYGPNHKSIGTNNIYTAPDKDGFVTVGLLWTPGKAVFYANGIEVGRWENQRVCNVPCYMMFTIPSGGWDGNVLDESMLPDDFVIDYVRVWQDKQYLDK
jgi:beta-glucanase (GH16 family)